MSFSSMLFMDFVVFVVKMQGLANDFQVGGSKGDATRKLPTPKFKFLLEFWPLNFENAHDKQKQNF